MDRIQKLLDDFTARSHYILGDNLTGIYLHGSAVMGCFNTEKSDIDLILVVKDEVPDTIKRQFMDMVMELNGRAPKKGLELSIVKEEVCKPFVYPTPFELHFSVAHINWYQTNPADYVDKMKGTDKDLAAHFTILYHRGHVLYGKAIRDVFAEVNRDAYMDSIWCDIEGAVEDILESPMYIILNLCRVLGYKEEGLILSKKEGGEWMLKKLAEKDHKTLTDGFSELIAAALKEYATGQKMELQENYAKRFAEEMLAQIRNEEEIGMAIYYKKLSENEVDRFMELRINQLREEGATEDIDLVPALKDYYTRHLADGTFVSWLAMDGEKIVGTSGMSFVEKPPYFGCPSGKIGLLSSMYTLTEYRRKGIARELLSRVMQEAKEYGCGAVQITASDMGVLLYTDFGFVKNGNFMQYKF